MKLAYFNIIDLSDSFSFNSTKIFDDKKTMTNRSGVLLIAIEYKDEMMPSFSKFLINPLNYKIRKDDIGYAIAYDQAYAKGIMNFSENSPNYTTYLKNMNLFKKLKISEATNKLMEKMKDQINERLSDWKINKLKYFKRTRLTSIDDFDSKLFEIPDVYNLYTDNTPKGIFKNHIIIKGEIIRLKRIASVLRSYSERPIVLFSDVEPNPSEWQKIRDGFRNIYYVYGSPTNTNHLMQIDPKKAYKILVLSSSCNNFNVDSESIIFTRIISDFFEVKNFLTELMDENNLKYIGINPKHEKLDFFFWPLFIRGSIHFSSLAMSIIAKTIINKNWLSFIRNLAKPSNFKEKSSENFEENSRINTIEITAETKREFKFFGQLQYVLMSNEPQLIGIAVMKAKDRTEPKTKTFLSQMVNNKRKEQNKISMKRKSDLLFSKHILKTLDSFYGSEILMTNPSFLMPLHVGDHVLVIGSPKIEVPNEYLGKCLSSSIKFATPRENFKEKVQEDILKFSFSPVPQVQRNNKEKLFKEKLGENLTNFNDFMKYVLNNWEDLNGERKKCT